MAEVERSLQKRPELNLEQLKQGGLIVGSESSPLQGSLLNMTGIALERITRERTEVPPGIKLPERPVYFLDPVSRRLVMISNREGDWRKPETAGLFGEIVELDEEGKPHYLLSNSDIPFNTDTYQLVAIGPNESKMPPSHIEVVDQNQAEKDEEEQGKKQQFTSWNTRIADLSLWMNDLRIDPAEDLPTFLGRYHDLKQKSQREVERKIALSFPGGLQAYADNIVPINYIVSDDYNREKLCRASIDAGLYPVFMDMKDLVEKYDQLFQATDPELRRRLYEMQHWWPNITDYNQFRLNE